MIAAVLTFLQQPEVAQSAAGLYALICLLVGVLRVPRGGRAAALLHLLGRLSALTFADAPGTLKLPGAAQPQHQPPPIPAEMPDLSSEVEAPLALQDTAPQWTLPAVPPHNPGLDRAR